MRNHETYFDASELHFRFPDNKDVDLLLSWRNNPNVRKYSRDSEVIDPNTHAKWFAGRLKDLEKQPLFIFIWQQNDIGIIRLDSQTDSVGIFEISVLVDEKFQNRGFATTMISQVIQYAKKNFSAKEIRAVIHLENYQSINLFTKLNFCKTTKIQEQFEEYSFIC